MWLTASATAFVLMEKLLLCSAVWRRMVTSDAQLLAPGRQSKSISTNQKSVAWQE